MDPATISAFAQLFKAAGTSAAIAIVLLLMLWWLVKGPIANLLAALADKARAEGEASAQSHAAHVEVLGKLAAAVDATHASIVSTVAADGDRTRAAVAEVGEGVDALASALPRSCPVPSGERPDSCPITHPTPVRVVPDPRPDAPAKA